MNASDLPITPERVLDALGSEETIAKIYEDFVRRIAKDEMIGFFFRSSDLDRLALRETEFATAHLLARGNYQGRSMPVAHGGRGISGGHFKRRMRLLKETLDDHLIPEWLKEHWLSHDEALRSTITNDTGDNCHSAPRKAAYFSAKEDRVPLEKSEASELSPDGKASHYISLQKLKS